MLSKVGNSSSIWHQIQKAIHDFVWKSTSTSASSSKRSVGDDSGVELEDGQTDSSSSEEEPDDLDLLPRDFKMVPACYLCREAEEIIVVHLCRVHGASGRPLTTITQTRNCFGGDPTKNYKFEYEHIKHLVNNWFKYTEKNIGHLIENIKVLRRKDILRDETLIRRTVERCQRYYEEPGGEKKAVVPAADEDDGAERGEEQRIEVRYQHPVQWPVRPIPKAQLSVEEAMGRGDGFFDAYVSYDEINRKAAWKLVKQLEQDHKFKLCIPQRDLLAGGSYVEVTSELIMNRCKRTILIITPEFSDSQECKFHAEILVHLSRGNPQKKYVPIFTSRCNIPHELEALLRVTKVSLTKNDDWEWQKLLTTLRVEQDEEPEDVDDLGL